jgi:hypothetical protein
MNQCTVCEHAGVRAIDDLVLAKVRSLNSIAEAFGLHPKAVQRHRKNGHVSPRARQASQDDRAARQASNDAAAPPDAPTSAQGASPLELMRGIVASLQAVDVATLSPSGQREHFNTFRLAVESLDKMAPPDPGAAVELRDVRGLLGFLEDVHDALEPFVEARLALLTVLDKHRAELDGADNGEEVGNR